MIAHPDNLKIKKQPFNCAVIAITEVLKAYQNQGIATSMLKKMFTQLKALRFDAVLAFQIAGRGGKIYPKTCRI